MGHVMEIPVEGGGVLRVQGPDEEVPYGLVHAANQPVTGPLIAKADETTQAALDDLQPAIKATTSRLRALAADEVTVEFDTPAEPGG